MAVQRKTRGRPRKNKLAVQNDDLKAKLAEASAKAEEKDDVTSDEPSKAAVITDGPVDGGNSSDVVANAEGGTPQSAAPVQHVDGDTGKGRPLPKHLQDQIDSINQVYEKVQREVEDFKSNQAYQEGDVPVALHGVAGPGFELGQRSMNWLNPDWLDTNKYFRWSHQKMVDYHRGDGHKPSDYDEFTLMVKARGGGHSFDKTPEGHVQCGDLIMVETSRDWHEKLREQTRLKTDRKERRAKNSLYAKGEELGVEVYEGSEAVSPNMNRLMEYLDKELGPGAREAYLGR